MIEKFYNLLMDAYGDEHEDAIDAFAEWVDRYHGKDVTLDDLFVWWSETIIQARIMGEL